MINFSLNTCWRLIPTKSRMEVVEIHQLPFLLITFLITFSFILLFHTTNILSFTQPNYMEIGNL